MSSLPARAPSDLGGRTQEIRALCAELEMLYADIRKVAAESGDLLDTVSPDLHASASNLIHYLAFRRHDLRALQPRLAALGLSSLGRSEDHVLASIDAVRVALQALDRYEGGPTTAGVVAHSGQELLAAHTQALLGPAPANRQVRIMVTMPTEAARDYTLVHELVRAGMDCMRINCAHDDTSSWGMMIEHLRRASGALSRTCCIAMDLGGPKLRTGPLQAGAAVLKIRPPRDIYGRVSAPARVWLSAAQEGHLAPSSADAILPLPAAWLRPLRAGDRLKFTDARNARRCLNVLEVDVDGAWAELDKTSYIVPGMSIVRARARVKAAGAVVGEIASRENPIVLHVDDILVVARSLKPGRPATFDGRGRVLTPAVIGCTLPEVFEDVRCGEAIWFDDGKIGGVIESIEPECATVKITRARECGEKLRGDKGINFPDSALRLSALTAKDIEHLEFVVRHADMVSLSFANCTADVELLQQHLKRLGGEKLGVILKIETRRGFENLPDMLFAALRSARCGVMIARGDLAVECGFERLAEVQEEILWVCEAAHVPVIWATQVLESLAKEGFPSRAEITDAAMSERAECVMLNKGPHICQAVGVLDHILQRMQAHVIKKRSMLRELRVAGRFLSRETP
jgi:pyruvate kinase